jgi:hypothetical protein
MLFHDLPGKLSLPHLLIVNRSFFQSLLRYLVLVTECIVSLPYGRLTFPYLKMVDRSMTGSASD